MTNHKYRILRGDCLDRMRELEDGSVDAFRLLGHSSPSKSLMPFLAR